MGGGEVEGSSGLREAKALGRGGQGREALHATPLYILPQGYTSHLDLASFIFESQIFLGRRKQVGEWSRCRSPTLLPWLVTVVLEFVPDFMVCKLCS